MTAFALVFAALTALLHFYIFYLEVPAFGSAVFCRVFRIAPEQLSDVQAAFQNLGVYNLCLALCLCTGIGARLLAGGSVYALGLSHGFLCSGLGSIIVAGCFLFATAPDKRRAAIMQRPLQNSPKSPKFPPGHLGDFS